MVWGKDLMDESKKQLRNIMEKQEILDDNKKLIVNKKQRTWMNRWSLFVVVLFGGI